MELERARTVENVRKLMDFEVEHRGMVEERQAVEMGGKTTNGDKIHTQDTGAGDTGRKSEKTGAIGRNKWKSNRSHRRSRNWS